MARIVFLDSGPAGLASNANGKPRVDECKKWLRTLESAELEIVIPEIVDYEVRRELVRTGARGPVFVVSMVS